MAISNTLFREAESGGGFGGRGSMPPCMNCVLIEMGEMVCYTGQRPIRLEILLKCFVTQKSVQIAVGYLPGGGRNPKKDSSGSGSFQ